MKSVLYVDDDRDDLVLFRSVCQMARVYFEVHVACGGMEAISYLAGEGVFADRTKHPLPGFILLDLKMPGRDGFEVLRWVRTNPATRLTPVALYTASLIQADVIQGFSDGANYFITKPSDIRVVIDIAQAIDTCLGMETRECSHLARFSLPRVQ